MADILLGDLRDIWRDNKDAAEAVDTKMGTLLNSQDADNNLTVKQSGRIVEEIKLLERDVRTDDDSGRIDTRTIPTGISNVIVALTVYGVSGTDPKYNLVSIININDRPGTYGLQIEHDEMTTSNREQYSIFGQRISGQDTDVNVTNGVAQIIPCIPLGSIRNILNIDGTFESDEGVDCEVYLYFIT